MDGCCHGDNLRSLLINRYKPYLLYLVCCDMCLLISRLLMLSPWQHPSIHPSLSCLLPFYTIPICPLLDFSTCLLPFFGCTPHIKIVGGTYCLRLFVVVSLCRVIGIVLCMLLLLQLLYGPVIGIFTWTDYLRLTNLYYTVIDVLLIMCLPACFVTSADKRQLWVYLCYNIFTNISSEAICCCLMLMWCC